MEVREEGMEVNLEADLVNLEAGLAYTAFTNYSMKAIASEMYCDHAKSYEAVAVVKFQKIPICRYLEEIGTKNSDTKDYVSKIQPFICSTQALDTIEKVTRLFLGK